ncbi:MAG: ABC transporter permease [Phycisphaerales bacterium]
MFQLLLTRRYLTSKIMPLVAAGAVGLCTLLVLVTWSVMGGFLETLLGSGRTFVGDVKISWPTVGFAHYDDLCKRLRADPKVAGATPLIETFGLIGFDDTRMDYVNILAIDPATYGQVADYESALWWKPLDSPLRKDRERQDPRLDSRERQILTRAYEDGKALAERDPATGEMQPAICLGIEVSRMSERRPEGYYIPRLAGQGTPEGRVVDQRQFAPLASVNISMLPLDKNGRSIDMASRRFRVANEFRTGIYEIDRRTVFLPLDVVQRMLKMDAAERIDAARIDTLDFGRSGPGAPPGRESFSDPVVTGVDPARVTAVWVRAAPGVAPDVLRARCAEIYERFAADHRGDVPSMDLIRLNPHLIATWEQTNAVLVGAVKKETVTVLMLLIIISLVASALILAIFWAMVAEKTRDIGVLRAIGAGGSGVAGVWILYGLVIGVIGAFFGGIGATLIVRNVNEIHEWLGRTTGVQVWDPRVYYFSDIPSRIDPAHAALVLTMAVAFSVLGALVPAIRAARMDPVKALRFE